VTAIVNGEIYNHAELREGLEQRGHRWATNSDSEVVVHAYEELVSAVRQFAAKHKKHLGGQL